jgi:riboflavin biosynthesis pyrimidine reductase
MYEIMSYWASPDSESDRSPVSAEYRSIWQGADKVVYSRTLTDAATPRTRLERDFDPTAVQALKGESAADLSVGGPTLAAEALRAGLVDEVSLLLVPTSVGGGTPALPRDQRLDLRLLEERVIDDVAFLRYDVRSPAR